MRHDTSSPPNQQRKSLRLTTLYCKTWNVYPQKARGHNTGRPFWKKWGHMSPVHLQIYAHGGTTGSRRISTINIAAATLCNTCEVEFPETLVAVSGHRLCDCILSIE